MSKPTIVYLVVHECDDPYYPDTHVSVAFTEEALAKAWCDSRNDPSWSRPYYAYDKVLVLDAAPQETIAELVTKHLVS